MPSLLSVNKNGRRTVLRTQAEIGDILQDVRGKVESVWLCIERIEKYGTKTPETEENLRVIIASTARFEYICNEQMTLNANGTNLDKPTVEAHYDTAKSLWKQVETLRKDTWNTSRSAFGVSPTLDDDLLQPYSDHSAEPAINWAQKALGWFFDTGRKRLRNSSGDRTRIRMGCRYTGGSTAEFVEEQDGEPTQSRWAAPTLAALTAGSHIQENPFERMSITSLEYYDRYNDVSSGV
ncbi:hypothetical protein FRC08_017748 [Ceratobasidium sp. 394]|nr:hypothetical protein FRC08_017748 [Ceratobasidium sp. 394]KAG9091840.1 hypothetical protein FS749_016191 [Ceratobasidium sp. UAMH 11750]